MKNFISIFFACLVVSYFATLFFIGFSNNAWAIIIFVAFLLAVFITALISAFMNYESRIEELEKNMEQLLNRKQD